MTEKFTPKEETIGILLKNNKFVVPKYQRYYSWKEEAIIFLEDILNTIKERNEYFIGPMIVSLIDNNKFKVIDGQQRLITTTIIISVIRDIFSKKGLTDEVEMIFSKYLVEKEVYTEGDLRMVPNRVDKEIFEILINNKEDIYEKEKKANEKIREKKYESWKNIWSFYKQCYNLILDKIENLSKDETKNFLNKIIESIDKDIKVIFIEVKDESDAYLIFETLNDRGLQLSMADLLKNYLFSKISDESLIDEYELRWSYFLDEIGASKLVRFIRYYWIAKHEFIREKELFRKIKRKIKDKKEAEDLIKELEKFKKYYLNIISPTYDFWEDEKVIDYLEDLKKLGVSQHIPLLFSLLEKYKDQKEVSKKVWPIYITLIRRIICKRNPNEFERELGNICSEIREKSFDEVKGSLKKLNPKDNEVKEFLLSSEFVKSKDKILVKSILRLLNNSMMKELKTNKDLTLEHIFPLSKAAELEYSYVINLLGNMTLLLSGKNKKLGNKPYKEKLEVFKQSDLPINKDFQDYNKFEKEEIEKRTKQLTSQIINILKY